MKKLVLLMTLVVSATVAMAADFGVRARGMGDGIGSVEMAATSLNGRVGGYFRAVVRTDRGPLGVRGMVTRMELGADGFVHYMAHCHGSDGLRYVVEGRCKDGGDPVNDALGFVVRNQVGIVFGGATNRQTVEVRTP